VSDLTAHRWARRSLLAVGAASVGLLLAGTPARGMPITVGELSFTVPETVRPVSAAGLDAFGRGWQWRGRGALPGVDGRAAPVVLARADIASIDPQEILGLLLATAAAGSLPGLELGNRRVRSMPGGGDQTRIDLGYAVARALPFHGTILIATRAEPPAAVLVVVGSEALTAGTIDGILDSAQWQA
jgi:hypothetical protein